MTDRELQKLLDEALADGPELAPMTSRAMIRGRLVEVRQRPAWRVRERGDEYPRRSRPQLRLLAIGVALVSLLGLTFAVGIPGMRPPIDGGPATPIITSFPIDGQPLGIAVAAGDVWSGLTDQPAVVRLNPATGETNPIESRGRNCVSIAAGAGGIWVPSCSRGPLTHVDPATNEVSEITGRGQGQTTSPAFDGDTAWLNLDVDSGRYSLYDTLAETEVERRQLPGAGHIGAVAFGSAWAMMHPSLGPFRVARLDLADGTESVSIPATASPDMAAASANAIWISIVNETLGLASLMRVDPATNQVVAVIEFEEPMIHLAADGSSVWVLGIDDPSVVYLIDESTNSAIEVHTLQGPADALAVDGDTLWISRAEASEVVRLEMSR